MAGPWIVIIGLLFIVVVLLAGQVNKVEKRLAELEAPERGRVQVGVK